MTISVAIDPMRSSLRLLSCIASEELNGLSQGFRLARPIKSDLYFIASVIGGTDGRKNDTRAGRGIWRGVE